MRSQADQKSCVAAKVAFCRHSQSDLQEAQKVKKGTHWDGSQSLKNRKQRKKTLCHTADMFSSSKFGPKADLICRINMNMSVLCHYYIVFLVILEKRHEYGL